MHHALLVAALQVAQGAGVAQLGLEQGLAQPGHVAVAEDPEAAGEQPVLGAVPLAALGGQEPDQGLGHGQPDLTARSLASVSRHRQPRIDGAGPARSP